MNIFDFFSDNPRYFYLVLLFIFLVYLIERIYVWRLLHKQILKPEINFGIFKRTWDFLISKTPWYFTIIIGLIILNSLLVLVTESRNQVFLETYKYLVGALVGALIGGRGLKKED